jgi:hypothetical protein
VITDQDVHFHPPTSDHYTWAETNYFGFYSAEDRVHVGAYLQAKPNLGVVMSSVTVVDGFTSAPHEVDYFDCHVHLPMPEGDLDDVRLANGLSIRCTKPVMDYEIRFDGGLGVSFAVTYTGLMPPYDIHDPAMDPLADARLEGDTVSAHAYAGHWDQSGRVRGTLNRRGTVHQIDCVSSMDHSWGLRHEDQFANFCWLNANFDNDTSIHCIWVINPEDKNDYAAIVHGYVREGSQVYGLTKGKGRVLRNGLLHQFMDLQVEDKRGRSHRFTGTAFTSNPWSPWPYLFATHTFMRWELGGVIGWGEIQEVAM